jgi:hypothetical protein
MSVRYESEKELQNEIEKQLKCIVPDEIWIANAPMESPPFDKYHVAETIERLNKIGIYKSDEKRLRGDLLRSKLAAKVVEPEVIEIREYLFGSPAPPFDSLEKMQKWITEEAKKQPPSEGHAPRFGYKLDMRGIPPEKITEKIRQLFEKKPGIYGIEYASLAIPQGDGWTGHVVVSDGTNLRRLWLAVQSISKKLDCQEAQATGLILAGRIPLVPALEGKIPWNIDANLGERGKIELVIREPIPEEELIKAYRKSRKALWGKKRSPKPIRDRDLLLVEFFANNIDITNPMWENNRKKWNNLQPDHYIDSEQAFRWACIRASKKIYPDINLESILPRN